MRPRTVAVLGGLLVLLGGLIVFGLGVSSTGGTLDEAWVSDTPRDNEVNHHAVGVGPDGNVIVAPVADVPNSDVPITNTSCSLVRLDPVDGTALWRASIPAEDCYTHGLTQPEIGDVDRDGDLEVVSGTTAYNATLIAYEGDTGDELFRVPLPSYAGYSQPAVADVTSDPGPEVVAVDISGNVVVVDGDGTVLWRRALDATTYASPVVDDIDGDTQPEVLVGRNRGPILLSASGEVEWIRNDSAKYLATSQVDDDPAIEVFTAGTSSIRAYDGATGSREWTRPLSNGRIHTAADADSDGTVELYVGRVGGEILALNAKSGETKWSTSISSSDETIVPPPVLGDVNGDGQSEVIAVTNTGDVAVLDAESGAELARYERNVPIWTFATPADIDDDGRMEILVRYGDGRVVALDYEL
jgi:outer membrane protein assembly factor BamB